MLRGCFKWPAFCPSMTNLSFVMRAPAAWPFGSSLLACLFCVDLKALVVEIKRPENDKLQDAQMHRCSIAVAVAVAGRNNE
jgi:hypothetical protein